MLPIKLWRSTKQRFETNVVQLDKKAQKLVRQNAAVMPAHREYYYFWKEEMMKYTDGYMKDTTGGAARPRRTRRVALLPVLLAGLLLVAAACGEDTGPALLGTTRTTPLDVGSLQVQDSSSTERRAGGVVNDGMLSFKAAPDRVLLVYFGYTHCPDVCPTTLADVRAALRLLEPEERARVDFAFLTVDPERDTSEVLNNYMSYFFDTYHVVSVPRDVLQPISDAFLARSSVSKDADGEVMVTHTAVLSAVDASGTVVVEWPFGASKDTIANDLRILLDGA